MNFNHQIFTENDIHTNRIIIKSSSKLYTLRHTPNYLTFSSFIAFIIPQPVKAYPTLHTVVRIPNKLKNPKEVINPNRPNKAKTIKAHKRTMTVFFKVLKSLVTDALNLPTTLSSPSLSKGLFQASGLQSSTLSARFSIFS